MKKRHLKDLLTYDLIILIIGILLGVFKLDFGPFINPGWFLILVSVIMFIVIIYFKFKKRLTDQ